MPFSRTPCQVLLVPEHSVSPVRISSLYPILSLYIFPANILDTPIHSFYKGNYGVHVQVKRQGLVAHSNQGQ